MMTRVQDSDFHRWIIFYLAFILLTKANAESLSPSSHELQSSQASSRTTVFAVLITVFFLVGLFSIYVRHCKRSDSDDSSHRYNNRHRGYNGFTRRGGLDDAVVESFPVFAYSSVKESKIGSSDLECAICLNELEDRETVRLLPICSHLFHIDCIDAWLYSHTTCPVCRSNLTAKSETTVPARDHVVINIDQISANGKFRRSNSTGHSMDRFGDETEKYTLRVPDDVKRQIMEVRGRKLKRTRSFDAILMAEGKRKCSWCGEESTNKDKVQSG